MTAVRTIPSYSHIKLQQVSHHIGYTTDVYLLTFWMFGVLYCLLAHLSLKILQTAKYIKILRIFYIGVKGCW